MLTPCQPHANPMRPHSSGFSAGAPGVLIGPLPVRKCHQMSSKEHMQLGWVVRWVLITHPGPPCGWAPVRRCRASTASLAPLYSPCALPAFGRGSKPPSRSALAPVESSPGPRTHCPFHRFFYPRGSCLFISSSSLQNETNRYVAGYRITPVFGFLNLTPSILLLR
jgi:hypothetical protein